MHPKKPISLSSYLVALLFVLGLCHCSGAAPVSGPDAGGMGSEGVVSQSGTPERPTVMVDSGPQESCPYYYPPEAEGFQPDKVPEKCREAYTGWWNMSHYQIEAPESEFKKVEPQGLEVDCSPYLNAAEGYQPEAVPPLCRQAYIDGWNQNTLRRVEPPLERSLIFPLPPPPFER